jgi:hypothetical protein
VTEDLQTSEIVTIQLTRAVGGAAPCAEVLMVTGRLQELSSDFQSKIEDILVQ